MERFKLTAKNISASEVNEICTEIVFEVKNIGKVNIQTDPLYIRPHDGQAFAGAVIKLPILKTGETINIKFLVKNKDVSKSRYGIVLEGKYWITQDLQCTSVITKYERPEQKIIEEPVVVNTETTNTTFTEVSPNAKLIEKTSTEISIEKELTKETKIIVNPKNSEQPIKKKKKRTRAKRKRK